MVENIAKVTSSGTPQNQFSGDGPTAQILSGPKHCRPGSNSPIEAPGDGSWGTFVGRSDLASDAVPVNFKLRVKTLNRLGAESFLKSVHLHRAETLLDDPLLGEISQMKASVQKAAGSRHLPEYYANVARHTPVFLAMARKLLDDPSNAGHRLLFIGRGGDLLYDAALFLSKTDPKYAEHASRLTMIDLSRQLLDPGHRMSEWQYDRDQLLAQAKSYLRRHGIEAGQKTVVVDDYQSAEEVTTSALCSILGRDTTKTLVLYSNSPFANAKNDFSRQKTFPPGAVKAAALFLSHQTKKAPEAYDGGRAIEVGQGLEERWSTDADGAPTIKYSRYDLVMRYRNRLALFEAALEAA